MIIAKEIQIDLTILVKKVKGTILNQLMRYVENYILNDHYTIFQKENQCLLTSKKKYLLWKR